MSRTSVAVVVSTSVATCVALLLLAAGCATIIKGRAEKVSFSSDPSRAKVYVNGSLMGRTPLQIRLESKMTYNIEFREEGYENKTVVITNSVGAGWIVLDVLLGFWPVVIDAVTGSWCQLDQTNVNAALEKQQP